MRIALDAMGGDHAPAVNIEGAVEILGNFEDIEIILVGNESSIKEELDGKKYPANRLSINTPHRL